MNKEPKQIVRYNPSIENGLDDNQIKERIENKLVNKVKSSSEKSYFKIVFDNIFTFFNIMMVIIAVLLVSIVGLKIITNLVFLLILFCNTVIGIYQECKCKMMLSKLKILHTSHIDTIRNGKIVSIMPESILLDDIIVLKPGDQVPADCIIESDGKYEVNESLMTGESCSIKKVKGDTILAGSYIITGKIYCRADKIGKDTYLYSIENKAKGFKKPKSMLITALNKIIKILVFISIPVGFIVGWTELINQGTEEAFKWGSLAIIYSIPAGMLLLASVAMMLAVIKLARKKTLTQDLYSVEALSRIDTLCLDKTGTLTDGTMTVEKVLYFNKDLQLSGIISSYLSAFDTENQTSTALINKFGKEQILNIKRTLPFSSERKFSAVEFERQGTYILGAPEFITSDEKLLEQVEDYTCNGLRVIMLAKTSQPINKLQKIKIENRQVMAMFILRDNIRKNVADTIKWFNENDVDIRVISGDNVKTVSYIAKQCGIKNANKILDMSTLKDADRETFRHKVLTHQIYGRVTPDQKAEIVDVLQAESHVVGMTGDGVNDVISLKKADCSIALGSGAPATKNISNFILVDDDFNCMKDAVLQGRGVINNVQRSSSLFVMKDVLWLIMMIIPVIFSVPHVFESTVIALVETLIIGIGSILLTLEPSIERIKNDFFKTVINKATVAGIYLALPILFIHIYAFGNCGVDITAVTELLRSMIPVISICTTIGGFIVFWNICKPITTYRWFILITITTIAIMLLTAVPDFFLINGTEYMQQLLSYGSIGEALQAIISNIFSFNIYKQFTWNQWLIISIFLVFGSFLYILTSKIISYFTEKKYKKESQINNLGDVFVAIKNKLKKKSTKVE